MDFSFSKSQALLKKSARNFLEKECKEMAREYKETDDGHLKKVWKKMAQLGWMGLGIPDEYGGLDGEFLELVLLLEEMGRVLLPSPFISAVICSGLSILEHGSEDQKKELLPKLTDGKLVIVPAVIKPAPFTGTADVADKVEAGDNSFILSGTSLFVPYANFADWFIFNAKEADDTSTLFLVENKNSNIKCTTLDSIASNKMCEVVLNQVEVPAGNILGKVKGGNAVLNSMNELGSLSHAAFLLGALEKVLEMTVGYAKDRIQFEKPIGSFQIIQHQLADMSIDVEQVKYLTYYAGWKLGQGLPVAKEISMAKARASDAARRVSLLGIKIHGGMGLIEEYDLHLYFRFAKAHELAFGDGDYHRDIVAGEIGLE